MQHEEWRPVTLPEYREHYEVSSLGRVRRTSVGCGQGGITKPGRHLTIKTEAKGYGRVLLSAFRVRKCVSVHRLVALAFIGEPSDGQTQINHRDGNPSNNVPSNLEWCNAQENSMHSTRTLQRNIGEMHGLAKLTAETVSDIRARTKAGEPRESIAALYGITSRHVRGIQSRRVWRHVP